tara:strand:+ start:694 stop:843 length:150 start_codon:yes stop_codon:yes gene_type:complete
MEVIKSEPETKYNAYTFALSSVFDIIYGHIMLKAPVLVRPLQLSNIELC